MVGKSNRVVCMYVFFFHSFFYFGKCWVLTNGPPGNPQGEGF